MLVVNTCAFIDNAKEESINAILEMAALKNQGKCSRLVVTGCLAERYRDELRKEIPEIDALLGTGEVPQILGRHRSRGSLAAASASRSRPPRRTSPPRRLPAFYTKSPRAHRRMSDGRRHRTGAPDYIYDADTPRLLTTPRHFAYVKIAEGCDYTCAFCIIPTLRGAVPQPHDRLDRARGARPRGARRARAAADLAGHDVLRHRPGRARGAGAPAARAERVDGLEWIRLLYLYPTTITDDVLDAMAECEKVCRYVDLPLQHASAAMLKRMRRPGNAAPTTRCSRGSARRVPGVTLRTTFIVGFPGETDADFAELERSSRTTEFDHVGVFTYSHEEGTRALRWPTTCRRA